MFSETLDLSERQRNADYEKDGIDLLDIADGLTEIQRRNKFTSEKLLTMPTLKVSDVLGIDVYVAKRICESAKRVSLPR